MDNVKKAEKKVDELIKKAKQYRDKKGYRENLGYDSIHKLEDFMETLNLHYTEKCEIKQKFFDECRKI